MDEYPGYTFTQSAAAYNEWMADKYPDLNAEIKKRIEEGRWEIVGGMWVEPDLNMPDGESLVRQLLVGKRWYKQAYGVDVRIGWNPDSFGYNWQLPQIYKKSGVDYFLTQKMSWNDTNKLPFKLFWWQSPDGSKVLTYFPNGYGNDDLRPLHLGDDLAAARNLAPGMDEIMDLYGVGDHGGGPTRAMLDQGFHWDAPDPASIAANGGQPVTPHYEFGTAQSFFSALEKEIAPESPVWNYQTIAKGYTPPPAVPGKISIPTWDSELYFEYHRGVMTTQAMHKHNMRVSEEEMLNAEKWSSLAWLDGAKYPARRADRRLEEGALQPVPRPGRGLRHRGDLQGRAEGLRLGADVDGCDFDAAALEKRWPCGSTRREKEKSWTDRHIQSAWLGSVQGITVKIPLATDRRSGNGWRLERARRLVKSMQSDEGRSASHLELQVFRCSGARVPACSG